MEAVRLGFPKDVSALIHEFTSDKIGLHPIACCFKVVERNTCWSQHMKGGRRGRNKGHTQWLLPEDASVFGDPWVLRFTEAEHKCRCFSWEIEENTRRSVFWHETSGHPVCC